MSDRFYYKYTCAAALRVTDEDAADFLQSQFSADLRPSTAGRSVYGLWLDVKGKVIGDSTVLCLGEADFLVLSEYSLGEVIQAQLERHIIADDVVIEPVGLCAAYAVLGEVSEKLVQCLGGALPESGSYIETNGYYVYAGRRGFETSYEIVCRTEAADALLVETLSLDAYSPVELSALHAKRIAAGIPLIPAEIGLNDLPGEGGLVAKGAASLNKGCYLGQEVVARMHNVGRPQRGLFKVSGVGKLPELPLNLSNEAGKVVGQLRTAYMESSGDTWFGVGLLKTRYVELKMELGSENGAVRVEACL